MNLATNLVVAFVSMICFAVTAVPAWSDTPAPGRAGPGNSGKADAHFVW